MHALQPWIGIALLGVSWLLGLTYYEPANPWAQAAILVLAAVMLWPGEKANPFRATREAHPGLTAAIVLLFLPVAWWSPWPYRLAVLAIIAGLLLERAPLAHRWLRPIAAVWVTGGTILLSQAVALTLYAAATARSHDLPGLFVKPLAWLCRLAGIEAAGDGPTLVVQTMRQSHRLAVSWDMVFDPATLMFLVGGVVWITIDTGRVHAIRLRWSEWGWSLARLASIVAAWLPVRALLLFGLYLHRASVSEWSVALQSMQSLHVMNQFLSPWVLLAMLVPPALLAWRWVPLLGDVPLPAKEQEPSRAAASPKVAPPKSPVFKLDTASSLTVKYLAAAACCLFGAILIALGLQCEPIGARKAGRVMIVEKHSPWSPSQMPFNTEDLGGGDDERSTSYNYAAAYQYLSQYYEMSRLNESDAIDAQTLAGCDVLVIKIPRVRYTPAEVQAVVDFVANGGGLLLIGDHTNLERSAANMNDISRAFGFTFRDDVLFSTQPAADDDHYQAAMVPHPAIEHVPEFDFEISCSIDPGYSRGRPVVAATGLWSMPGFYHNTNFMPYAEQTPEIRFGSFVQAWSTHGGQGRVIAWGDSTIFSNFCLYQPGKAEVLLNLVEWLNHQGGMDLGWLWTALGLGAICNGLWLVRQDSSVPARLEPNSSMPARLEPNSSVPARPGPNSSAWLVLVAATACGWVVGSSVTSALLIREMPLPKPLEDRAMKRVVIDRTISQVPLAKGAFYEAGETGRGFGLLEQAIPRMGYSTARGAGNNVFQGDALVIILPTRPASEDFRRRLVDYVDGGGRLLVIDAGLRDVASTTNQLLRPFGLALDYSRPFDGELVKPAMKVDFTNPTQAVESVRYPAGIHVDSAWQITGGTGLAAVHVNLGQLDPNGGTVYEDHTICAVAQFGKGQVIVASFGNMFADRNMGGDWSQTPNAAERARYDLFFALMRRLVNDEPIVVPSRTATTTAPPPSIKVPLNRPGRNVPQPRGGT
jgi:hypothetical protein